MTYALVEQAWSTPWLIVIDSLRTLCALLAFALCVAAGIYVVGHPGTAPAMRLGAIALALLAASVLGAEFDHLGGPVTYRLATNLAGLTIGLIALLRALRRPRER